IRDRNVTGVQTCALPIFEHSEKLGRPKPILEIGSISTANADHNTLKRSSKNFPKLFPIMRIAHQALPVWCGPADLAAAIAQIPRSEERRVGKDEGSWCGE